MNYLKVLIEQDKPFFKAVVYFKYNKEKVILLYFFHNCSDDTSSVRRHCVKTKKFSKKWYLHL